MLQTYSDPHTLKGVVLNLILCLLIMCYHTAGLRDLVDFLPASLAAIVSYFSAEITRGIWKPVPMNGIEWPSPGASLHSIEAEIKEILASAGVQIHSCYPRMICIRFLHINLIVLIHNYCHVLIPLFHLCRHIKCKLN